MADITATITCPGCGHRAVEQMPTEWCVYFYECRRCRQMLKPKPGDCCVFCSYADKRCPPVQDEGACRFTDPRHG
jgi:hypothetical protein